MKAFKEKFTPGPWEFSKTAHGEPGLSILSTDRSSDSEWVKWEIARVGLNSKRITSETEANARLIAAAPELLECLKSFPGAFCDPADLAKWVNLKVAALNKAEGK